MRLWKYFGLAAFASFGAIAAMGLISGLIANAASGDTIYRDRITQSLTGAQAVTIGTAFLSVIAWTGAAGDVETACIQKSVSEGITRYVGFIEGLDVMTPTAFVDYQIDKVGQKPVAIDRVP